MGFIPWKVTIRTIRVKNKKLRFNSFNFKREFHFNFNKKRSSEKKLSSWQVRLDFINVRNEGLNNRKIRTSWNKKFEKD